MKRYRLILSNGYTPQKRVWTFSEAADIVPCAWDVQELYDLELGGRYTDGTDDTWERVE